MLLEDLATHVQSILRRSSNTGNQEPGPPQSSMPLTPSENLTFLVEIRQRHQTKEAEKGVRITSSTAALRPNVASSGTSEDSITERHLLAQKIREIVKDVDGDKENMGSSTGLNRRVRWTKTPGLYSPSLALSSTQNERKSGNSANALDAAVKAANLVRFLSCATCGNLLFTVLNCTGHQEATIGLCWPTTRRRPFNGKGE